MFGVFKGRDRIVVAPTCYLSGMFLPFSSYFCPSYPPLAVVCHMCVGSDGAAGAPLGANVSEYLLLAHPLFCVYFRGGATCGWFGCAKTTGVLIEPGFHFGLGFWHPGALMVRPDRLLRGFRFGGRRRRREGGEGSTYPRR